MILLLPFTALMALLSVTAQSAKQATLWAMLSLLLLPSILKGISAYVPFVSVFLILIPGAQFADFIELDIESDLFREYLSLLIPIFQSVILLAVGRFIMLRAAL